MPAFTFYNNLTDFRVVGQTWMQPVYKALESEFESLMNTATYEYQYENLSLPLYAMWYTGNYSYYILAALLANYSTASPYAVFSFPSIVPHEGTIFVRLFMPGQVFPMKVYYLGQEVFNNLVPVPQPNEIAVVTPNGQVQYVTSYTVYEGGQAVSVPPGSIVIETSVYPVTFNITSKSGLYPVGNTYLGLTFTDVLYREYVMPGTTLGTSTAQQYISNILYPFSDAISANSMGYSSGILTPSEIYAIMNNGTYAIVETYGATKMDYNPRTVLGYEPVTNYYSMAGYVLPNLMGFFVNSSSPTIGLTPLYMTSIFPNVFSSTPSIVVFNLTMGIPTYSTILGTTATAYPNDTLLYAPSTSYSEYRLLINETLLPPTYVSLNGTSGQPSATLLETIYPTTYAAEISQQYYSVLNFTYVIPSNVYPASYRLWEAYINATGMSSITNATIGIYAANATVGTSYIALMRHQHSRRQ